MKKSILSFGSIMILFMLVFSCTEEQENVKLPDESVNLKGEVNNEKQEADENGTYNVSHLLTYLHDYINIQVTEDFKYYENIPERKEANWFFDNFKNHFNSGSEADKWALEKIESGEIHIFGTTVKDVKVAGLIFSEGLEIHEQFNGKKGFFFDTATDPDCAIFVQWGFSPEGPGCFCYWLYTCDNFGGCWSCSTGEDVNLEDIIDLDPWIINEREFEKSGGIPVSKINIGDPVLQLKRK